MILDSVTEASLAAVVELLYTGRCHLTQVTELPGDIRNTCRTIVLLKLPRHPVALQ